MLTPMRNLSQNGYEDDDGDGDDEDDEDDRPRGACHLLAPRGLSRVSPAGPDQDISDADTRARRSWVRRAILIAGEKRVHRDA